MNANPIKKIHNNDHILNIQAGEWVVGGWNFVGKFIDLMAIVLHPCSFSHPIRSFIQRVSESENKNLHFNYVPMCFYYFERRRRWKEGRMINNWNLWSISWIMARRKRKFQLHVCVCVRGKKLMATWTDDPKLYRFPFYLIIHTRLFPCMTYGFTNGVWWLASFPISGSPTNWVDP